MLKFKCKIGCQKVNRIQTFGTMCCVPSSLVEFSNSSRLFQSLKISTFWGTLVSLSSRVEIWIFSGIFWRLKEGINRAAKHQDPITQLRDVVSQKNGILSYTAGRTSEFAITLFYTRRKFVSEANRQEETSHSSETNKVPIKEKWFMSLYMCYMPVPVAAQSKA